MRSGVAKTRRITFGDGRFMEHILPRRSPLRHSHTYANLSSRVGSAGIPEFHQLDFRYLLHLACL